MTNEEIRGLLDGLASRGVLSKDGRNQVFRILLDQAKGYEQKIKLLEDDVSRLRNQRDAALNKLKQMTHILHPNEEKPTFKVGSLVRIRPGYNAMKNRYGEILMVVSSEKKALGTMVLFSFKTNSEFPISVQSGTLLEPI